MSGIDPYDPQVARRNRRLAAILFIVVFLVILAFIIRFSLAGLPKDRKEWSRIQQRESRNNDDQQAQPDTTPSEEVNP